MLKKLSTWRVSRSVANSLIVHLERSTPLCKLFHQRLNHFNVRLHAHFCLSSTVEHVETVKNMFCSKHLTQKQLKQLKQGGSGLHGRAEACFRLVTTFLLARPFSSSSSVPRHTARTKLLTEVPRTAKRRWRQSVNMSFEFF